MASGRWTGFPSIVDKGEMLGIVGERARANP
jgi:hypothetical protein